MRRRGASTLREGVTFHNGNPFNADDVVYSYKRQAQETSDMGTHIVSIQEIKKIDDLTIEIFTKGPDPDFAVEPSLLLHRR